MEVTLKIKGIYTAALTKLFIDKGVTVVSPSEAIAKRLRGVKQIAFHKPIGAEISDLEDSQKRMPIALRFFFRDFFSRIDREAFRFAWEPRGVWPEDLIRRLCEKLQLIHCVDPFKNKPTYTCSLITTG